MKKTIIFIFNDPATTEIYTLSLHDALPISHVLCERPLALTLAGVERVLQASERYGRRVMVGMNHRRSEEHTSELQSQSNLVCRLLLEKKHQKQYQHQQKQPD